MAFKDIEMKKLLPAGINTVDHTKRVTLGLSCLDYCIYDTIVKRKMKKKDITFLSIETYTQLNPQDITYALECLENLNLIKEVNGKILVNMRILNELETSDNKKYEKEFEAFWNLPEDFKYNVWPGAKKDSYIKFVKARKIHSFDFIINQRSSYIELLKYQHSTGFNRAMMIATKFLNLDTGQVSQDYGAELKALSPQKKPKEKQRISLEDKNKLYL